MSPRQVLPGAHSINVRSVIVQNLRGSTDILMSKKTTRERFDSFVIKGEQPHHCWLWVGAVGDDGYGRFWVKSEDGSQRVYRAHRYAMTEHLNRELDPDEYVLHRCDNPLCVKVTGDDSSHLWLGTHALNMAERSARGRSNFQALRSGSKKERAQAARSLRDAVLVDGYDHSLVQQFIRELDEGQGTLF